MFPSAILAAATLAACGDGGIAGNTYGGDECFFESLEFTTGDSGYVSQFGMQKEFTYEIDGDRVIVKVEGDNAVFTIGDDGSLDGGGLIGKCVEIDS
jgi:hypothetical protein